MIVLGLTGSIGMGKSTASKMLRRMGVPIYDADAEVHRMMRPGGEALKPVLKEFPEAGSLEKGVDRVVLGKQVFGDPAALKRLEKIIHPRLGDCRKRFLRRHRGRRTPVVVLDVPLLFEIRHERDCDAVLVVTAPFFLQKARVMARPNMSEDRLKTILKKQIPDAEKRRRADFIAWTSLGKAPTQRALSAVVRAARSGEIKKRKKRPVLRR